MKRSFVCAAVLSGLVFPATSLGAGGTYTVVQCDPLNRASNEATLDPSAAYAVRPQCGDPEQDFALKIDNVSGAQGGRKGRIYWQAPAGTSIVGVTASVKLRNDNGHRARVFIADGKGREVKRLLNGDPSPSGWKKVDWSGGAVGHERFTVTLSCEGAGVCPQSDQAKAWVRNVRLMVADEVDPVLERVDGSLFDGGWLRGDQSVRGAFGDQESGMQSLSLQVGGSAPETFTSACSGELQGQSLSRRFAPCGRSGSFLESVDTAAVPFHDGTNQVHVCGDDFGGNQTCENGQVLVDNTAPNLAFRSQLTAEDPELIQAVASDEVSGLASGEIYFRQEGTDQWRPLATSVLSNSLEARVDSAAEQPGPYDFLARAVDQAGNQAETTQRQNGEAMVLQFPLRSGVQLRALLEPGGSKRKTLAYGRPGHVGGKLLTAADDPMARRDVTVVEHFGDGALLSKRTRTVRTDGHGNWSERVPPGPSRRITASFDGDQRYLPAEKQAGRLFVRSQARFKTSRRSIREGKRIIFSGKVRHLGAHIPPGGKLVELQVRERPGRWNTVREAFYTNGSGKYRIGYRFGRFYVRDAKFRFRVKVTREQGWPYKAPVRSRKRVVIVRAHK